jgi:hypothetical protein
MEPVVLENVRIIFRNFTGAAGRFNAKGDRNFNVLIDDETAEAMAKDGWNIKYLRPREEGDAPQARLEVKVKYVRRDGSRISIPPRVMMITSRGKTPLDESMVMVLDWADIENVDMIIRPVEWDVNGKQGIAAYLKAIYVTVREDELERKYLDVPDSAGSALALPDSEQEGGGEPPF